MQLAEALGRNIKEARLKAGMSVNKLSEEAYVTRASINKYESGKGMPSLTILADIHKALNIPLWELLPTGGGYGK